MSEPQTKTSIIGYDEPILITGATGFIGSRLVENLLARGFRNLRCFSRPYSKKSRLHKLDPLGEKIQLIEGNLLSREDCRAAVKDVAMIFHLAAGRGEKSVPDAFMNSVVTTRNLLDAVVEHRRLKRFVNISSFAVYTNMDKPQGRLLDESCPVEAHPELRADAYDFAKVKQDEIVHEYGQRFGVPYVIVRPGYVFGPGNKGITGRVGIGTFGLFLHLGGFNTIPFTYVDNCADAIALAGLTPAIEGEAFNVVDDDLPSSRQFLRLYKKNVKGFKSLYVPHVLSYFLCWLWDSYSRWSEGQLPPAFNLRKWHSFWKKTRYSNNKSKARLGWRPKVPMAEGLGRYFEACRGGEQVA
jgi:nucleoside-diphosphate-sugar epimerase